MYADNPYICRKKKCRYHTGNTSGMKESCGYFFATGKTKHSQGVGDHTKECPLFETGKKPKTARKPKILPKEEKKPRGPAPKCDRKEMERLYLSGASDGEIGRKLGVTANAAYHWRKSKGLPANVPRGRAAAKK